MSPHHLFIELISGLVGLGHGISRKKKFKKLVSKGLKGERTLEKRLSHEKAIVVDSEEDIVLVAGEHRNHNDVGILD